MKKENSTVVIAALAKMQADIEGAVRDGVREILRPFSDDEMRELTRSGKLDIFMQKIIFDIIRERRASFWDFRRFLSKVTGKE